MRTRLLALAAAFSVALGCSGAKRPPGPALPAPAAGSFALTVVFTGRACAEGTVLAALYDSPEEFDAGNARLRTALVSGDPECRWSVGALPAGRYAVKAFLDLDGDGELARNALGAPAEPYGLSLGVRGRLGPPPFSAAAFTLGGPLELGIEIR